MNLAADAQTVSGMARSPHIVIAAVLAILPLLPFLNRPLHIDDPLFVWTARHILENPFDFYGFDVNWYGRTQPMHEVNQNPPLVSYYLAVIMHFAGSKEWALHLAMLFSSALAGAGAYHLAARICGRPMLAALLTVVSPAFVVSGTTLMCDMTMLAFWLWAVSLWLLGLEKRSWKYVVIAAFLAGSSAFSKYFGASLVPLLAVYTLCQGRAQWRYLVALALPICMLAFYEGATAHLYGRGLFFDAVWYASEFHQEYGRNHLGKVLVCLIFLGGCLVFPLFPLFRNAVAGSPDPVTPATVRSPSLWYALRRFFLASILGIIALILMLVRRDGSSLAETVGLDTFSKAAQGWFWAIIGLAVLVLVVNDFLRHNRRGSVLLGLWLGGVLTFACFVNHYINARVLLPAVVPAAILVVRSLEASGRALNVRAIVTVGVTLLMALLAAMSDYRQAENGRQAARDAAAVPHEGRLWFVGHWGFQYYMEQAGALPLELDRPRFRAGETVIIPDNNTNLTKLDLAMIAASSISVYPSVPMLSTMRRETGAGLHTDVWGPLPFAFGPSPDESYARIVLAPPPSANP